MADRPEDIILARLEERFEQLLNVVNSIKTSLDNQTLRLSELDRKIVVMEQKEIQLEREILELKANSKQTRQWLYGIVATVIGGVILAGIKFGFGI